MDMETSQLSPRSATWQQGHMRPGAAATDAEEEIQYPQDDWILAEPCYTWHDFKRSARKDGTRYRLLQRGAAGGGPLTPPHAVNEIWMPSLEEPVAATPIFVLPSTRNNREVLRHALDYFEREKRALRHAYAAAHPGRVPVGEPWHNCPSDYEAPVHLTPRQRQLYAEHHPEGRLSLSVVPQGCVAAERVDGGGALLIARFVPGSGDHVVFVDPVVGSQVQHPGEHDMTLWFTEGGYELAYRLWEGMRGKPLTRGRARPLGVLSNKRVARLAKTRTRREAMQDLVRRMARMGQCQQ